MIDILWNKYKRWSTHARNEALQEELAGKFLQEASDLVVDRPDTTQGWVRRYAVNDFEKGHQQSIQFEAVRKSREFDRFMPHAHGILNTMVNYIMGKGLSIQPKADDPMVWYIWREFATAERNKWVFKQFEIIRRTFRDGEVFIRFYNKDDNGNPTGKTTIRFMDPLLVRHMTNPSGKPNDPPGQSVNNGVITEAEDVEEVIAYQVMHHDDQTKFDTIPADEMVHIKINADSDQKRGEPGVQAVLQYYRHYEQWIENRIILNKMRTAIVLMKKVEGTPTEVANMSRTLPTAQRQSSNETKQKNFRPGTIITAGPGVTYEMLSPNINASDVKEDGRNIILAMCAAMNLPEFVLGDASNANYASTMMAESPFVKMIQYFQIFFEYHFGQIYKKVLENAVNAKLIEEPSDDEFIKQLKGIRSLSEEAPQPDPKKQDDANADPNADPKAAGKGKPGDPQGQGTEKPQLSPREAALKELMPNGKMEIPSEIFYGADFAWPEIIHREVDKQVNALTIARQNGWVSDPTAASSLGYDYAEEVRKQRQVEEEAAIEDNPLLGSQGDAGDMASEMQGIMSQLTPEERNTIMSSDDPKAVQAIMDKYQVGAGSKANGGDPNGND